MTHGRKRGGQIMRENRDLFKIWKENRENLFKIWGEDLLKKYVYMRRRFCKLKLN